MQIINPDGTLDYKAAGKLKGQALYKDISMTDLRTAISLMTKDKNIIEDKFNKNLRVTSDDMDKLFEINQIYNNFYSAYFNRRRSVDGKANEGGGIYTDSLPVRRGGCNRNRGIFEIKGLSI